MGRTEGESKLPRRPQAGGCSLHGPCLSAGLRVGEGKKEVCEASSGAQPGTVPGAKV